MVFKKLFNLKILCCSYSQLSAGHGMSMNCWHCSLLTCGSGTFVMLYLMNRCPTVTDIKTMCSQSWVHWVEHTSFSEHGCQGCVQLLLTHSDVHPVSRKLSQLDIAYSTLPDDIKELSSSFLPSPAAMPDLADISSEAVKDVKMISLLVRILSQCTHVCKIMFIYQENSRCCMWLSLWID